MTGPCKWVTLPRPDITKAHLYCLPFAGGMANYYRNLQRHLKPHDITVHALGLPGREGRPGPLHTSFSTLLHDVAAISQTLESPTYLFGYSLGALIAYELIKRATVPLAQRLFVAGMSAPHCVTHATQYAPLDDDALIAHLMTDPGHFGHKHPEMIALQKKQLPALRAEHAFYEQYHSDAVPLSTDITVFAGKYDAEHPEDAVMAWQQLSNQPVDIHWYEGHHLFLDAHAASIAEKIIQHIQV